MNSKTKIAKAYQEGMKQGYQDGMKGVPLEYDKWVAKAQKLVLLLDEFNTKAVPVFDKILKTANQETTFDAEEWLYQSQDQVSNAAKSVEQFLSYLTGEVEFP